MIISEMRSTDIHILNGSALKRQLDFLPEEAIAMQEAMIEGPVSGDDFNEVMSVRIGWFEDVYEIPASEYRQKAWTQIDKINQIHPGATINLWFENDLFCQTNLWFILWCLYQRAWSGTLFYVSPGIASWNGFGILNQAQLEDCLKNRMSISDKEFLLFAEMWLAYQHQDFTKLKSLAVKLSRLVPPLDEVVQAHIDRYPSEKQMGRPERRLLHIIRNNATANFNEVFQRFSQEEGIYGFGDVQIKRMLAELEIKNS